ncbi:MAG: hypothetical protein M1158_02655 [Candidatus Marsarchaeota archaeon]|nr:hypothetical protein [Candidatus Marsarchaeota archaeon]
MSSYPVGVPFASYNTDLIILLLGFIFLELTYRLRRNKGKSLKGLFFSGNHSEIEKVLWFFLIGLFIYILSIPLMVTIIHLLSNSSPYSSISFLLIKPTIFSYFLNIDKLISNFKYLAIPVLIAISSVFIITTIISIINVKFPKIPIKRLGLFKSILGLSIIFILFAVFYYRFLTPPFNVTDSVLLTNSAYYILSGHPTDFHVSNSTIYQNLTLYNETVARMNISFHSDFAYFLMDSNTTSIPKNNISKFINQFTLPGSLYLPNYACGSYTTGYTCKQKNLTIDNQTSTFLLIQNVTVKNKTMIFVPLQSGPLSDQITQKIVNISSISSSCVSNLCSLEFSIKDLSTRGLEVNGLAIPSYYNYNLSEVNASINGIEISCYHMPNQIICNGPDGSPTIVVSSSFRSLNSEMLAIDIVTMAKHSEINFTISLSK